MERRGPTEKRTASGKSDANGAAKRPRPSAASITGRSKSSSGKAVKRANPKLKALAEKFNHTISCSWGPSLKSEYENKEQLGRGTFGYVYKAVHKKTKKVYAIKSFNMKMELDGFPKTAIQEIIWLKQLRHKNIVNLYDVIVDKAKDKNRFRGGVHLVLEFVPFDLSGIMEYMPRLGDNHIKCYLNQLLQAVHFMHSRYVINRDIKPANILISYNHQLKLADWGLAREFNPLYLKREKMTERVVTIWYRSPDLLLGCKHYGVGVDIWSVGCVFGEMLINKVVFPARGSGRTQEPKAMDQLKLIWDTIGGWDDQSWPGHKKLPYWHVNEQNLAEVPNTLRPQVRKARGDPSALDLLDKLLCPDPKQRIHAKAATLHEYFWGDTLPKWRPQDLEKITEETVRQMEDKKREKTASHRARQQRFRGRGKAQRPRNGLQRPRKLPRRPVPNQRQHQHKQQQQQQAICKLAGFA